MKHLAIKQHKGFSILAIILVIVAVIVTMTVWAFSGSINDTNSSSDKLLANNIIKDGAAFKATYDRLIINGANYDNIVFLPLTASTPTAPNMFDPVNGMEQLRVTPQAIRDGASPPEGIWTYSKNFTASYVGDRLLADPSILIGGIKTSVCKQINMQLYGSTSIPSISGFAQSNLFVQGSTLSNPNTNVSAGIFTPEDMYWMSGCISANNNPDNNLYFMVLKPI